MVTQQYDTDPESETFGDQATEIETVVDTARSSWDQPIAESAFQVSFALGARVSDELRGVSYVLGNSDTGSNLRDLAAHATKIVEIVDPPSEPNRSLWSRVGLPALVAIGVGLAFVTWAFLYVRNRRMEYQS
jgi:hypothetical protein